MAHPLVSQSNHLQSPDFKVAVWDTYVTRDDGRIMHFDIIVPAEMKDTSIIHGYGWQYLNEKKLGHRPLTARECRFCHIEIVRSAWANDIRRRGYYIYEMENCD